MPTPRVLLALVPFTFFAAACGGSDGDGNSLGVASLEDVAGAAETDEPTGDGGDDSGSSPEDAALEFSQCMRDEGLDFPDIGVDAEGNPDIRDAFETAGFTPRDDAFRDAMQACGEILQGVGFGGGGRAQLNDNTEFQDALVEFSGCVRDQGFDVGDLQFGGGPGGGAGEPPVDGEPPERGQGQGEGGFGDRNTRLAQGLGLDPEDPDVTTAIDECASVIDTALADLGVEEPGGRP